MTTPDAARARELLEQMDRHRYPGMFVHALADCLRASLEREEALKAEVERLCSIELPAVTRQRDGAFAECQQLRAEIQRITFGHNEIRKGVAFQGRQTGRNRADIPTDAGVPSRGDAQDGSQ